MLAESTLFPFLLAGLMNGSFVVPSRYVSEVFQKKLWFYYSLIGLVVIPWILAFCLLPQALNHYLALSPQVFAFIVCGGLVFGIGQLFFITAIERIGLALGFAINLSIGVTIGSMFVVFYKSSGFSFADLLATLAVCLIIVSLIIYYQSGKIAEQQRTGVHKNYLIGWLFAILAGMASGFQNISFFIIAFHATTAFSVADSFWVWPPFLLFAAIPMAIGFYYRYTQTVSSKPSIYRSLTFKDIFLASLMGLLFTGSLALYSHGMSQLNAADQVLGWPTFMVSIILASQIWGKIYGEGSQANLKSKLYQLLSIALLIVAIILLSIRP